MGGGMGMMGMGMNGMGMGGMNAMGMGMMGGMPLPMGMGDVSGSAGGDSEARADTDADAEESDAGANNSNTSNGNNNTNTLSVRRRGEDEAQTQQTPRAGVVRLPSPVSASASPSASVASSPGAGPSSASVSSSPSVHEEDEGELDEEEGEVVVAVRDSATGSGTMRRAGTVRATRQQPHIPDVSTASTVEAAAGRISSVSSRDRGETARQAASSSSASISISAPPVPPAPRANQHHTPHPGAPRVPAATAPVLRARRATAAADAPIPTQPAVAVIPAPLAMLPPPGFRTARESREDRHSTHHAHAHAHPTGPYRDEDVLLSLQLLAYLSKYPHVRQAFYKRRHGFHPASPLALAAAKAAAESQPQTEVVLPKAPEMLSREREREREREKGRGAQGQQLAFLRAFGVSGSKEKEKGKAPAASSSSSRAAAATTVSATAPTAASTTARPGLETNVFSLVERFTFRPSSSETDLPNPPPKLPQEIQYWAGVIMRNACRKDDSRGGIRQCANMLCGRWEEFPREFAKCRRCRKAKYCGKECQSTAWSEGHRFWCSAKEGDDAPDTNATSAASTMAPSVSNATITPDAPDPNAIIPVGAERRERRERYAARERERLAAAVAANAVLGGNPNAGATAADAATVRGFRSGILGAHPSTVSAVFGGTPAPSPTSPTNAAAGPSRERTTAAPVSPPADSTRSRAIALLRRTANPLGAVGSPALPPQRREREREAVNNSYATFDTYMAERRRAETSAATSSTGTAAPNNHLHHPQPQNPADIDRYLASFAAPPRRRVSRTSRDAGDSSQTRSSGTIRDASTSESNPAAGEEPDNMVLE
ncbi:hypothetical protein C8R46DRAFT_1118441 [Mycena filopes]|nr:hypothetical protein C8R46DRAFT_1118441 [Mycena filopes]